jgi:hypothetical protein
VSLFAPKLPQLSAMPTNMPFYGLTKRHYKKDRTDCPIGLCELLDFRGIPSNHILILLLVELLLCTLELVNFARTAISPMIPWPYSCIAGAMGLIDATWALSNIVVVTSN